MNRALLSSSVITSMAVILIAIGTQSCTPKTAKLMKYDPFDTAELAELMTGSFNSNSQAATDTNYYAITLEMHPIWPDEAADYLYVEQAVISTPSKPYRQRVYKLEKLADGGYKSLVYTLNDEEKFIGKWKKPQFFDDYSPEDIILRDGCAVYLYRNSDGSYSGSTLDQNCESTMRGASYATSVVDIRSDQISSWDQGFDAEGKQVWGAEQGPYIFKRKADRPKGATPVLQKQTK